MDTSERSNNVIDVRICLVNHIHWIPSSDLSRDKHYPFVVFLARAINADVESSAPEVWRQEQYISYCTHMHRHKEDRPDLMDERRCSGVVLDIVFGVV